MFVIALFYFILFYVHMLHVLVLLFPCDFHLYCTTVFAWVLVLLVFLFSISYVTNLAYGYEISILKPMNVRKPKKQAKRSFVKIITIMTWQNPCVHDCVLFLARGDRAMTMGRVRSPLFAVNQLVTRDMRVMLQSSTLTEDTYTTLKGKTTFYVACCKNTKQLLTRVSFRTFECCTL